MRAQLPWPDLASFPDYGLVRPRQDVDSVLAQTAVAAGARLIERTNVTGPMLDDAQRVVGVTARPVDDGGRRAGDEVSYRAPIVLACDGVNARLALSLGLTKRDDRPMGRAVRTYFTSPRHDDDWLESWLDLRDGSQQIPGYGWVFGVGNGTCNVGIGNSSTAFGAADYKDLLHRWIATMPVEWGFSEANQVGEVRGAAIPMGFNRTPAYTRGLLLLGDAGGLANPFNGEGIAYAMESARLAAEVVVQALARPDDGGRERVLQTYPDVLKSALGSYFTLGRAFSTIMGNRHVLQFATTYGLPRPTLMKFVVKMVANLHDPHGGDALDRVVNGLTKLAPAA